LREDLVPLRHVVTDRRRPRLRRREDLQRDAFDRREDVGVIGCALLHPFARRTVAGGERRLLEVVIASEVAVERFAHSHEVRPVL
jgi:hypothetical protein